MIEALCDFPQINVRPPIDMNGAGRQHAKERIEAAYDFVRQRIPLIDRNGADGGSGRQGPERLRKGKLEGIYFRLCTREGITKRANQSSPKTPTDLLGIVMPTCDSIERPTLEAKR